MRIRIVKPIGNLKVGEVIDISKKKAYKLISTGKAIVSKELLGRDYKTK